MRHTGWVRGASPNDRVPSQSVRGTDNDTGSANTGSLAEGLHYKQIISMELRIDLIGKLTYNLVNLVGKYAIWR